MALEQLKQEPMMAHLMATLDAGNSIGHYGRLVFAMVGRYFLQPEELCQYLEKDPECDGEQARSLLEQVEARDYNPPKRERILEWMKKQDFPVCPEPANPGVCNVYRNLDFPRDVYERIEQFHRNPVPA
jgi:hypothetical protein